MVYFPIYMIGDKYKSKTTDYTDCLSSFTGWAKLTRHDMLRFYYRFLECHLTATCLIYTHSGVQFYNF